MAFRSVSTIKTGCRSFHGSLKALHKQVTSTASVTPGWHVRQEERSLSPAVQHGRACKVWATTSESSSRACKWSKRGQSKPHSGLRLCPRQQVSNIAVSASFRRWRSQSTSERMTEGPRQERRRRKLPVLLFDVMVHYHICKLMHSSCLVCCLQLGTTKTACKSGMTYSAATALDQKSL